MFDTYAAKLPWKSNYCDFKGFAGKIFLNYGIMGTPTFHMLVIYWMPKALSRGGTHAWRICSKNKEQSMLQAIKRLFEIRKKTILLNVPFCFPTWHSRFGEETGFAKKIKGDNPTKIHAIKRNTEFWQEACRKFATGRYRLKVVHMKDIYEWKKHYPIIYSHQLHIQQASFIKENNTMLVDGKDVRIEIIARNEGYSLSDFMEFMEHLLLTGQSMFCIVHFTPFCY